MDLSQFLFENLIDFLNLFLTSQENKDISIFFEQQNLKDGFDDARQVVLLGL